MRPFEPGRKHPMTSINPNKAALAVGALMGAWHLI
jgi:hypothetical protein